MVSGVRELVDLGENLHMGYQKHCVEIKENSEFSFFGESDHLSSGRNSMGRENPPSWGHM